MPIDYIVVVPVFKHSVLVVDTLRSLLCQNTSEKMKVIVVDDGCPFSDTLETLAAFRAAHPERISVYRQKNRGLSGARNTGIEIALRDYPGAEGIYFLDADNILEPWALKRAGEACRRHPEADWFFPDIANFGVRWLSDYQGNYDILELLEHNYCEAGSFVRMRVFESGVRFDENMKLGYEDWDFWLQATAKGFRGQYLPDAGFRYRKRGESMLSDSDRDRPEILGYIRRKHRANFLPKRIVELEDTERPRSLFVDVERRQSTLGLAPAELADGAELISIDDLATRLAAHPSVPLGSQVYFGTQQVWAALSDARLLHWTLWECERLQSTASIVALRFVPTDQRDSIAISDEPFPAREGQLFYMSTVVLSDCAKDPTGTWLTSLTSSHPEPSVRCISIELPSEHVGRELTGEAPMTLGETLTFIEMLRRRRRTYEDGSNWRRDASMRLGASKPLQVSYDWHQLRLPFPRRGNSQAIHIGFVLPLAAFGGVERVAHQTAHALRALGMVPHLIVIGPNEISLPAEFGQAYETVRFYRDEKQSSFGWAEDTHYYGTALPALEHRQIAELAGLCADLDVVINGHSGPINLALANLRRCGLLTACSQHVFDIANQSRSCGHPFVSLAFEHAYDAMLPVSQQMERQLHSLGVPRDKLVRVQNASGFQIDDFDVEEAVAARQNRQGPLRCLFMGRLDPQKGGDRLEPIRQRAKDEGIAIDWRIVGKSVIGGALEALKFGDIMIEPPVLRGREIAKRLAWADIVLLPSRYEGLPLLVHEAMSFGVIVIATNVGAINELIAHEDTGFVIRQTDFIEEAVTILKALQKRPPTMRAMSRQASARARSQSWAQSVGSLADWINAEYRKRQNLRVAVEDPTTNSSTAS